MSTNTTVAAYLIAAITADRREASLAFGRGDSARVETLEMRVSRRARMFGTTVVELFA